MTTFYIMVVALVILALLIWYLSVHIKKDTASDEQLALAREQISTYRLRLKELAMEKKLEELDEKEYSSSVDDLKRQLLHDLTTQQARVDGGGLAKIFVPGTLFLLAFVAIFYWSNGQYSKLHELEEAAFLLPSLGERAVMEQGEPLSPKELRQFALGLRNKLHYENDDAVAWLLLGRVTQALDDLESAELAFESAYMLDPKRVAILLNYSQILLMRNEPAAVAKAAGMLREVLGQEPGNVDAMLMIAYIAEQRGDTAQAETAWKALAKALPDEDPRLPYVEQKLREMQAAQLASDAPAPVTDSESAKVTVKLSLDESLAQKVPQGAILFVYAKAAEGPPMPAAVVKMDQFELPMSIELSDANAMMDSYKLSNLAEVVIWSRVSQDQNIAVSPGELQGKSQAFKLTDTTEVAVVIDQIL